MNIFSKAKEAYAVMAWADLKKDMEKVLEIDPSFAMAYVYLAYANYFLGDSTAINETLQKAMAFSDRTSEKDRLYLESAFAYFIKGDHKKHEGLLKELIRKYPKEKFAYHYLGDFYYSIREYVGACDQFKKWLELDPRDTFAINHLLMATIPLRDFKRLRNTSKCARPSLLPMPRVSTGRGLCTGRWDNLTRPSANLRKLSHRTPTF